MRISFSWAAFSATSLVLFIGSTLTAQQPAAGGAPRASAPATAAAQPRASTGQVVVIDINEVFKHHLRHKAALEDIKEAAKAIEASAQEQQKELVKLRDQLGEWKLGSPEYKNIEIKMAQKNSDLTVTMQLKRKEFVEREAKVYFNTYKEIEKQVAEFATRNGISLVLRFSKGEMDADKPDTVAAGIQRPVVYHSNLDITQLIIESVNRGTPELSKLPKGPTIPPRPQSR